MKLAHILFALIAFNTAIAQTPYTTNNFTYKVDSNITYGTAIDFAGISKELKLDLYKPNNANCSRPCLILVHGGAWMAGSKTDQNIVNIARDFAAKGWVVATINYRLGMHKVSNYDQYALCGTNIAQPCTYMADSSEVIRAIYRAQQDVKGAIRAMKTRSILDSTDVLNFFVAGESAGGFNALAATFLNDDSEKFPQANAIANAPTPDSDLLGCLPSGYSLSRPDLGPIDGTLNLGTHNSSVQGVGNIYGGVINLDLFANETNWPEMYFFHQGSDVIVNYNYGKLLGRLDWECFAQMNVCQSYSVPPFAYGSKGIKNYLSSLPSPPAFQASIIENYDYLNNCLSGGHGLDNWTLRSQEMANLFAQRLQANGNTGNASNCNLGINNIAINKVSVTPNPSTGSIFINGDFAQEYEVAIICLSGQIISTFKFVESTQLSLEKGVYFLQFVSTKGTTIERIIIQ